MNSATSPERRAPALRKVVAPLALLSAAALAVIAATPAAASTWRRSNFEVAADGRLVDVQVMVEGRGAAPLYMASGHFDRRYFQAFQGRNYSLALRNNTGRRVGVLIAVDGLNVINGERSALARNEAMYVLDPWERAVIRGWRTSLDEVRRFVFVDEERSYAERTGQANGDMGWIRVLAFREQRPFWEGVRKFRGDENEPYGGSDELRRPETPERGELQKSAPRAQAEAAPGAPQESKLYGNRDNEAPESSPGTGWGQRQQDHVNRTSFMAEGYPVDRITLRYEYESALRSLGIFPVRFGRDRLWERERGQMGFAKPPQW